MTQRYHVVTHPDSLSALDPKLLAQVLAQDGPLLLPMLDLIEPRLTGHKLGLSPLIVLLSLAIWGWLWGIVGLILAVPLTVICKIILENIRETKPLATLISHE